VTEGRVPSRTKPRPLVSVVIGVHNDARYLREAMDSVLRQEGVEFEVVIVDDGSSDGTAAMLSEYARRDERVRVMRQENQGLTAALVRGCAEARGDYIARQDADDRSEPGRLRTLARMLDADEGLAMASSGYRAIGPEGEILYDSIHHMDSAEATRRLLHKRSGPIHGTVMFRRTAYEAVKGYRLAFYYAQDSDLWLRLGEVGRIAYAPEVLYCYRWSPKAVSVAWRDVQKRFGDLTHVCRAARLRNEDEGPVLLQAAALGVEARAARTQAKNPLLLARGYYFIASALLSRGDLRAARYLVASLRADPRRGAAWAKLLGMPLLLPLGRWRRW
jgi:glycosyltransferase involved in cell wall biosynthesis